MVTNRRLVDKEGEDLYVTPCWATQALIDHEKFEGTIWEPACGLGHMVEVLKSTRCEVYASDLYDRGYGDVMTQDGEVLYDKNGNPIIWTANFLTYNTTYFKVNNVITNPPYNIAEEFIHKAFECTTDKVCMLLRTAFVEGSGRYNRLFSVRPPTRVWAFSERVSMYPNGEVKDSGGTTSFSWFVWDMKNENKTTELCWIPPGYKPKKPKMHKGKK